MISLQQAAAALGGDINGERILCPGPGHSHVDRSLSVMFDPSAPGGFIVHSFAGDDPILCKDHVRDKCRLEPFKPAKPQFDEDQIAEQVRRIIGRAGASSPGPASKIVATYDYTDGKGALLYQVVRYEPKSFRQRRSDGNGAWIWNLDGVSRVPYRLQDLLQYPDGTVFVCEGEKDADRVASLGHCATTAASGKWTDDCVKPLAHRDVFNLEDNDDAGRKKAITTATLLRPVAKTIRIVRLPGLKEHGDVSDWLDADAANADKLVNVCLDALIWEPAAEQQHEQPEAETKSGAQKGRQQIEALESALASSYKMKAVKWIWPNRFAIGKLGIIAGLPDEGKGQILCYITARLTSKVDKQWPCGEGTALDGNVILLTAEDDPADTVVPRLAAAQANLDRVHIVKMVRNEKGGRRMFSLVSDLDLLRRKVLEVGNVIAVEIDPISAYLGHGKMDSFRTTEVRAVLGPLVDLAGELGIAIVAIMHFNKKMDVTNALLRISDSLAFGAAARHVYGVIDDAENKRKLFVRAKNNLSAAAKDRTMAYSFSACKVGNDEETGEEIWQPFVLWDGKYVDVTATQAMQAAAENRSPGAIDNAKNFLVEMLEDAPAKKTDIEEAAEAKMISERTLRRARELLKIEVKKEHKSGGAWFWRLPDRDHQWPWEEPKRP
jgi:hypothetical protein